MKHHLRPFRACNPGILATLACLAPGLAFAATVAESPRPLPRTTCSAGPCFSQSATSEARALPGGIVSPFIAPPGSFTLDDSAARPPGSVAPSGGDFALEGTRDAETPLATDAPAPVGAGVTPAAFDVASRRLETFRADHAALVRAVTGEPATRMNLAEFYLAHAMPPEGLSALEEVSAEGLSREGAARLAALRGALRALDGEDIAGETGFAKNAKEWPDRDLFRAISAARTDGDPVGGADVLDAAVARLDAYPPHFQEDIILDLLELAVVHDHAAAKIALSDRAHATPDLRDSNRLVFLAGMSAAAAGRTDDAVALFQEASRGEGRAAHRATIRLADLGLRRGTPNALRDAVSVLEKARHDWRGDALELELLSRLATGYRALSDMQRAAATLGDIVAGFPETDVAKRADADLREILDALYAAGRAREIPISDLLMFHRQNAISFRHLDGFETYVEHFALTLEAAGMTSAAATEYERARMIVAGASDPDRDRITGLRLKRIAALIEGGQYRTALAEAARIAPADDTVIDERRAELLAAAAYGAGDRDTLEAVVMRLPTSGHIRNRARLALEAGDWKAALESYRELADKHAGQISATDAIDMLRAAVNAGDRDAASLALRHVERTARNPAHAEIAAAIAARPAAIVPLSDAAARERMQRSGDILQSVAALRVDAEQ